MLSCEEATRLVSKKLDRDLSLWRRLGLRLHVAMCRGCSRYTRQVTALHRLVSGHYADEPPTDVSAHVSQDVVRHIKSSIRQATPGTDHQDGK